MLLTLHTLPQLAVSAKLLCLLMVVICGAVPSMVRSVQLYNDCSSKYVSIDERGKVEATGEEDSKYKKFQNLTITSLDFNVTLTIYAEAARRYLCFNKNWKLVGVTKKHTDRYRCLFYEEMCSGYSRYRSVSNESMFVGFNRRGMPVNGGRVADKCIGKAFQFIKRDPKFDIPLHNSVMASGGSSAQTYDMVLPPEVIEGSHTRFGAPTKKGKKGQNNKRRRLGKEKRRKNMTSKSNNKHRHGHAIKTSPS